MDVLSLTRKLLSFNTVNPPGNEQDIALFVGQLLDENGFKVEYNALDTNRLSLIATKGLNNIVPPIVLTGHFDTVPLGAERWTDDPFSGIIKEGKIYGRGSSDMKGGVAAMIVAALQAFQESTVFGGGAAYFHCRRRIRMPWGKTSDTNLFQFGPGQRNCCGRAYIKYTSHRA